MSDFGLLKLETGISHFWPGARMYQVFKDFAGPIATIIAAFAAVSVTWRFAWRQTQIAKEQADIAKQKLLHDVFERQYERRYRIYRAARKLLWGIAGNRNVSNEDLRAYVLKTGDAVFLFDDDLPRQLVEIHNRAVAMQTFNKATDNFPVGDQRKDNCIAQSEEHFNWLVHQAEGLVEMFKPFLKLSESQIPPSVTVSSAYGGATMRPILISLALIAETGLIIATVYVFYRWRLENAV